MRLEHYIDLLQQIRAIIVARKDVKYYFLESSDEGYQFIRVALGEWYGERPRTKLLADVNELLKDLGKIKDFDKYFMTLKSCNVLDIIPRDNL